MTSSRWYSKVVTAKSTAPNLELDWEESFFKFVRSIVRRFTKKTPGPPPCAVAVEPVLKRLEILASLVSGRALHIVLSDGTWGLRANDLLLPKQEASLDSLQANAELLMLSVLMLAAWRREVPERGHNLELGVVSDLTGQARALAALCEEFPGFAARWRSISAQVLAQRPQLEDLGGPAQRVETWRRALIRQQALPSADEMQRLLGTGPVKALNMPLVGVRLAAPGEPDGAGAGTEPSTGTEREAPKKIEDVRRTLLDEDEDKKNPIVHTFEKVETLDAHEGGARIADGSDELDDQLEALEEVDLKEVIRGGEAAQSILRVDLNLEGEIPDVERIIPGEAGVTYPEWDFRRRTYRADWCTVYPTPVLREAPEYARAAVAQHRRQIEALYRRLSVHRSRLRQERRQLDGEDIDLDAAIEATIERAGGRESSAKIYTRRTKQVRDVAAAVLVDVSLSTDSWVHNRRVLDVAKQSVLVLGEVTERLGDQVAVYAFASKTRNACRVFEVAGFDTPWSKARARIGALEPQGYTRIGPAIRHVSAQLAGQPAQRRLLLVITDGKPSDYDKYEGQYGIADIRMSLHEAARAGVVAHALTIDKTARAHLSGTFGPGAWHLMSDPARLPEVLTEVYGRLSD